jgi:tetratricopeptide (TPR) repeat protein
MQSEETYKDLEQHYQKAIERDPSEHWNWFTEAPLRLQRGDFEGYCRVCREMLARFHQTDKPEFAERTAKTCLLRPGAVSDLGLVRQLAERAVTGRPEEPWFLLTQGMADYRVGDFLNAIARLNKTLSLLHDKPHNPALAGTAHVFLAMAHHQLGHAIEARRALDEATHLMDQGRRSDWADWLRFRLVYLEADQLVRSKAETLK